MPLGTRYTCWRFLCHWLLCLVFILHLVFPSFPSAANLIFISIIHAIWQESILSDENGFELYAGGQWVLLKRYSSWGSKIRIITQKALSVCPVENRVDGAMVEERDQLWVGISWAEYWDIPSIEGPHSETMTSLFLYPVQYS